VKLVEKKQRRCFAVEVRASSALDSGIAALSSRGRTRSCPNFGTYPMNYELLITLPLVNEGGTTRAYFGNI